MAYLKAAVLTGGIMAVIMMASCFCPVYWKLPWFSSQLRPVSARDAVVVTGASTGIGRHAALTLAKDGFTVFCGVRKERDGTALQDTARKLGIDVKRIKPILLDVVNAEHIASAAKEVEQWLQGRGLTALFNNAGVGGDAPKEGASNAVEHQSMDKYRWVMEVNFFGVVAVTKAFLPLLRKGKGRIVINTSIDGIMGTPFQSTYVASKFAAEGWADSLHREVQYQGIHVAMLEPGFVASHIIKKQADAHGIDVNKSLDNENYPHEAAWWEAFWAMSVQSYSPKVSSEAVVHAIRAERPARRYLCGFGSQFMRIAPRLPDVIKDTFFDGQLLKLFVPHASDEKIREAVANAQKDFEL